MGATKNTTGQVANTQSPKRHPFLAVLTSFVLIILAYFGLAFALSHLDSAMNSAMEKKSKINPTDQIAKQVTQPAESDADLLSYFTSIVFTNAGNNSAIRSERWTKPEIKIQLAGQYNDAAVLTVSRLVKAFNDISTTVRLTKTDTNGDIKIIFEPKKTMLAKGGKAPSSDISGWAWPVTNEKCEIRSAETHIATEVLSSSIATDAAIIHEVSHTLGFMGHDPAPHGCNVLTNVACGPMPLYSQYDISAIKMLYNSSLPLCSNPAKAKELFENKVPR